MSSRKQPIIIARSSDEIRSEIFEARAHGKTIALVPTMGALHEGHLSLIDHARQYANHIVVSIFVNPTQFGKGEDFDTYPRTWETDIEALAKKGIDTVYAPQEEDIYPPGHATKIQVEGPALELETEYRPHFFGGVATIVAKLLLTTMPDYAIFGEKDYQQLLVIKQMTRDLNLPCEIIGATTLREKDGLAMSSRNSYLTKEERPKAAKLYDVLKMCAEQARKGYALKNIQDEGIKTLSANGFNVDYLEFRNAHTLQKPINPSTETLRLLVAAHFGKPRLIDNIAV